MNKRIDFTHLEGNPFDQQTFEFMQESYRSALGAIAKLVGDKTILHGVTVTGTAVSFGWIAVNGELIPFIPGGLDTDVVIQETSNLATFLDGSQKPVEFTKVAFCGSPGNFPFADLKPVGTVLGIKQALDGLTQAFATHKHSYSSLTDLPAGTIVHKGTAYIGDAANQGDSDNSFHTISIPEQPDNNYVVVGNLVANSNTDTGANQSNDVMFVVYNKQKTFFKIAIRELPDSHVTQSLSFDYIIVK